MSKMKKTGNPAKATLVDAEAPKTDSPVSAETPTPKLAAMNPTNSAEVALAPADATLAQLGQERVLNAQLHLQNRQKELEGLLMQIKTKYEEGGKFALTAIDIPRGVITRNPV